MSVMIPFGKEWINSLNFQFHTFRFSIFQLQLGRLRRLILYKAHNPTLGASACWLNSHCTNSVGSFDCSCDTGWTIDIIELDNCVDIDEDR